MKNLMATYNEAEIERLNDDLVKIASKLKNLREKREFNSGRKVSAPIVSTPSRDAAEALSKIDDLQRELKEKERYIKDQAVDVKLKEGELKKLKERLDVTSSEFLQFKNKSLSEAEQLRRDIKKRDAVITTLKNRLEDSRSDVVEKLISSDNRETDLKKRIEMLESNIRKHEESASEKEKELKTHEASLTEKEEKLESLVKENRVLQEDKRRSIKDFESELRRLREDRDKKSAELERLNGILRDLHEEIRSEINAAIDFITKQSAEIDSLKEELRLKDQ